MNLRYVNKKRLKYFLYSISPFSMPFHNHGYKSDTPAIFIGGGRSGSTLLRVMLGRHSNIWTGTEFFFHHSMLHTFKKFPWLPKKAFALYDPINYIKFESRFGITKDEALGFRKKASCFAEFMDMFFNRVAEKNNKKFWIEKTARSGEILDYLFENWPKAKFIHIIRDGRDVICSMRESPKYRFDKDGKKVPTNVWHPLEWCFDEWHSVVSRTIQHRKDPRYYEIRYEDLVTNKEEEMKKLCEFIGVNFEKAIIENEKIKKDNSIQIEVMQSKEAITKVNKNRLARWKNDLNYDDAKYIQEHGGELLKELGYIKDDSWLDFYNKSKTKKNKILTLSYDWRNIFENNFDELMMKMDRDRLGISSNEIMTINWSNKTYFKKNKNISTVHLKTFITKNRVLYDFLLIFLTPVILLYTKYRPEILWIREFPLVFALILPKIIYRAKVVLFLGTTPDTLAKTSKAPLLKTVYNKVTAKLSVHFIDYFIANGQATKDYFVKLGVREDRVKIMVENIIERDRKLIDASKKGIVRKKYNILDNKRIILSVARLEPGKGFERLLKAYEELNDDSLFLIIAGDGILRKDLENLSKDLKIDDKMLFVGNISREMIWNFYQDADIFILLSFSEGNSTVFREAMYMNVPVIGSAIPGIQEFIGEDRERGYFWDDEKSVDELREKIELCLDKKKSEKVISNAKKYINENIRGDYDLISIIESK